MSEQQSALDLRPLDEQYDIIGELRGSGATRYFIGRRRADGTEVLVSVADPALGGDNNALAHFASDAQILANLRHRTIPRVLEGRWLGTGAFAVVSERPRGSTLHEMLSANGPLPNPRIATLLQDVNSAIVWARDHGVVHRGVTPESLYIDDETGQVRTPLAVTPIPLEALPGASADGRTIGALAWAMLAGRPYSPDGSPLRDLRRNLATRVIEETEAMLAQKSVDAAPDVDRFLSVIAIGDVLREGELEIARMEADMIEERRIERMRLEALARANAEYAAALEARLAKERAAFEQRVAEEEKRIASVQQEIVVERLQLEQERREFADRAAEWKLRTEIERPVDEPVPMLPLTIDRMDDALLNAGSRFGWMVPVASIAVLVLLIVLGSLMAHHKPTAPSAITVGNARVVPATPRDPTAGVPQGGFLTQSAGSLSPRFQRQGARDSIERPADSLAMRARDTLGRRDSLARTDTTLRRDSLARRDTLLRDTLMRDTTVRDTVMRGTSMGMRPDTSRS